MFKIIQNPAFTVGLPTLLMISSPGPFNLPVTYLKFPIKSQYRCLKESSAFFALRDIFLHWQEYFCSNNYVCAVIIIYFFLFHSCAAVENTFYYDLIFDVFMLLLLLVFGRRHFHGFDTQMVRSEIVLAVAQFFQHLEDVSYRTNHSEKIRRCFKDSTQTAATIKFNVTRN